MKLLVLIIAAVITLGSTVEARRAAHTVISPRPPKLSRLQRIQRSFLCRATLGTVAAVAAAVTIVVGIDQVWGPFWPTTPEVILSPPDQSATFEVPFTLWNKSVVVPAEGQFSCLLHRVTDTTKAFLKDVWTIGMGPVVLFTNDKEPFKCWFPFRMPGKIVEAHIEIMMFGRVWWWQSAETRSLGQFTWDSMANPPRWLPGSRIIGRP